LEKHSSILQ